MGRGRAKAKQTKAARKLKYGGGGTDLDRLRRELGAGARAGDAGPARPGPAHDGTGPRRDRPRRRRGARRVNDFASVLRRRLEHARGALAAARRDADDHGVQVHTAEVEALERLAAAHGVPADPPGPAAGGTATGS